MFLVITDTKVAPPELIAWLDTELEKANLSDSEASRRAGLSHVAIYDIRSGLRPGVKKCQALARLFGMSPEYVLRLAGHLPPEIPEHRRQEFEEIAAMLAGLPDGPIRDEAMAAELQGARRRLEQAQVDIPAAALERFCVETQEVLGGDDVQDIRALLRMLIVRVDVYDDHSGRVLYHFPWVEWIQ